VRAASLASEAGRNLATGTTRAALLALTLAGVVGALAYVDVRAAVGVLQDAAAYRASGSSVQVLEAPQGIDGARCDSLASVTGVVAAGALRQGETLRTLAMPASSLTVWEATPGLVDLVADTGTDLVGADQRSAGLWLSRDLADTLGARPGRSLATALGPATTAGVYTWPDDGRDRALGYAALAPVAPAGVFDQCWVQVWPPDVDAAGAVYLALDPAKRPRRRRRAGSTPPSAPRSTHRPGWRPGPRCMRRSPPPSSASRSATSPFGCAALSSPPPCTPASARPTSPDPAPPGSTRAGAALPAGRP
jgi:hypothetical protein